MSVAKTPVLCCRLAELVGHPGSHVKFYVAQAMLPLDVSYWIHSSRHLHITWVCCIRPALLPVKNIVVECTRSRCWTAGTSCSQTALRRCWSLPDSWKD
jgi:hypothetical protein